MTNIQPSEEQTDTENTTPSRRYSRRAVLTGGATVTGAAVLPGTVAARALITIDHYSNPVFPGGSINFQCTVRNFNSDSRSMTVQLLYNTRDPSAGKLADLSVIEVSSFDILSGEQVTLSTTAKESDAGSRVPFTVRVGQNGEWMDSDTAVVFIQDPPEPNDENIPPGDSPNPIRDDAPTIPVDDEGSGDGSDGGGTDDEECPPERCDPIPDEV